MYSTLDISPDNSQTDDSRSVSLLKEVFYSKAIDNPFNTTRNSKPAIRPSLVSNGACIIHAIPRRQFPEGHSSLGIQALWMTAHIGSLETPEIEARLDSGADITLMSQDFLDTLADPPKIQEGVCMQLYQLTGSARVLGYVRTKLLACMITGEVVVFELEAYVVHRMRVPLLLGEDFQMTYELGVACQASGQCKVFPLDQSYCICASTNSGTDIDFKAQKAFTGQAFLKGKHRAQACRQLKGSFRDAPPVLARHTVHISPGCVSNMLVDALFRIQDTWLVEKMLLSDKCNEFMFTLTTIISVNNPYIPIVNPIKRPIMI
ncbi:hypothetical protein BDN71DRAFT_1389631 [Pleurotus eryngii]|uniref:Peptidase A2 domain-containing protein n=1 Tax=Pleurotus eryngii TaxID=5323 RepID=A0A9P6A089_PLEER|nr:hypothetical protein BDN71DRAFT_1389631 [Pleurotus eryngii]